MTKVSYYEYCAGVIASVVSGGSVELAPPSRGVIVDNAGPVENIFGNEIAHAVAGISRKEANNIVCALLDEYESWLNDPPAGKKFPEYFNMKDGTPTRECLKLYREMRQKMKDRFGLRLPSTSPCL